MTAFKNEYESLETAIFAGGCFWHMEDSFQKLDGVSHVYTGYTGGVMENPTYPKVVSLMSDHIEAVKVYYNPNKISYNELLTNFWRSADLRESAIFYTNDLQKMLAEESRNEAVKRFNKPIETKITAATTFYMAEEEHQEYYKKNGLLACMNKVWGLGK